MDIDLLMDPAPENEAKVFRALEILPDKAVRQLAPGDVESYTVCRVADEIVIDLMASTSGIPCSEAETKISAIEVDGVIIPFASPELLWRMKRNTHREKDRPDLLFLRQWFQAEGIQPPE